MLRTLIRITAFSLAIGIVVAGAARTSMFVIDSRRTDERLTAQLEELQQEVRDLRARPAVAPPPSPRVDDPDTVFAVPVGRSPVRGPDDALVTIVAYLDYQCPFCGRAQETLATLMAQNPDVRLVVKQNPLPFHKDAMPAALLAECAARQGRFWPVHDRLFADQRQLGGLVSEGPWQAFDLDMRALADCRASPEARASVEEDVAEAGRLGARGTPTFFINGRKVVGAQPLERFQESVTRARSDARASGIRADRYYVEGVLSKATLP